MPCHQQRGTRLAPLSAPHSTYETYDAQTITKTCLYKFGPLKPLFYLVKLGFTGIYIIFLISAQNIDCWYSLEPPRRGGSNEYLQSMFKCLKKKYEKNIRIFI